MYIPRDDSCTIFVLSDMDTVKVLPLHLSINIYMFPYKVPRPPHILTLLLFFLSFTPRYDKISFTGPFQGT